MITQSVSQISYRDDDVPLCVGICGVSRGIGWCCSSEKASEVSCAIAQRMCVRSGTQAC